MRECWRLEASIGNRYDSSIKTQLGLTSSLIKHEPQSNANAALVPDLCPVENQALRLCDQKGFGHTYVNSDFVRSNKLTPVWCPFVPEDRTWRQEGVARSVVVGPLVAHGLPEHGPGELEPRVDGGHPEIPASLKLRKGIAQLVVHACTT